MQDEKLPLFEGATFEYTRQRIQQDRRSQCRRVAAALALAALITYSLTYVLTSMVPAMMFSAMTSFARDMSMEQENKWMQFSSEQRQWRQRIMQNMNMIEVMSVSRKELSREQRQQLRERLQEILHRIEQELNQGNFNVMLELGQEVSLMSFEKEPTRDEMRKRIEELLDQIRKRLDGGRGDFMPVDEMELDFEERQELRKLVQELLRQLEEKLEFELSNADEEDWLAQLKKKMLDFVKDLERQLKQDEENDRPDDENDRNDKKRVRKDKKRTRKDKGEEEFSSMSVSRKEVSREQRQQLRERLQEILHRIEQELDQELKKEKSIMFSEKLPTHLEMRKRLRELLEQMRKRVDGDLNNEQMGAFSVEEMELDFEQRQELRKRALEMLRQLEEKLQSEDWIAQLKQKMLQAVKELERQLKQDEKNDSSEDENDGKDEHVNLMSFNTREGDRRDKNRFGGLVNWNRFTAFTHSTVNGKNFVWKSIYDQQGERLRFDIFVVNSQRGEDVQSVNRRVEAAKKLVKGNVDVELQKDLEAVGSPITLLMYKNEAYAVFEKNQEPVCRHVEAKFTFPLLNPLEGATEYGLAFAHRLFLTNHYSEINWPHHRESVNGDRMDLTRTELWVDAFTNRPLTAEAEGDVVRDGKKSHVRAEHRVFQWMNAVDDAELDAPKQFTGVCREMGYSGAVEFASSDDLKVIEGLMRDILFM